MKVLLSCLPFNGLYAPLLPSTCGFARMIGLYLYSRLASNQNQPYTHLIVACYHKEKIINLQCMLLNLLNSNIDLKQTPFVVFANLKSDSVSRGEKKISLKRATLAGHFHYGQFTGKHKTKWSNFSAKCNKLESNKCDAGRRRLK